MKWFNVGKIVNTHGVRGEVRVISKTDFPEVRYQKGNVLYLEQAERREKLPLTITSYRKHKQFDLLTFQGYENINEVEAFKGGLLKISEEQLNEDHLDEGEFFYHQIIGCTVFTDEGEELGKITEILSPGANDVWVIQSKKSKKQLLIPYIDEVVKEVNINEGKIIIHVMEGLLE
ncbi:ribosome maturation factor RimM [Bacillus taeanensis]|uniref:Ribosome maturation factor RimM n=1 Tax=Bacillus taeanensis TaxID=273032 RepID=A0A366XME8_9BACI|nr:ribosome maturation factor RimM [Bacillus taeanensis]RBW67530.1 ribosome maturation factor RimM [Bacillus taeanensis]